MLSKEQVITKLRTGTWQKQGFNGLPLYLWCAAHSGWNLADGLGEGSNYSHFFYIFFHNRALMYYDQQDFQNMADCYYKKISTISQLSALERRHQKVYRANLIQAVEKAPQKQSFSELCGLAQTLCQQITRAAGVAHAIEGITFGSEQKLRTILEKKGKFSEYLLSELCVPVYPSFLLHAQYLLWDIKQTGELSLVEEFLDKYAWLQATYVGVTLPTKEGVIAQAAGLVSDPYAVNFHEISEHKEKLLEELKFSEEERFVVQTIQFCFNWQDERKKHILQTITLLDPVIAALAQLLNLKPAELKHAFPEELTEKNLQNAHFLEQLQLRATGSAYYSTKDSNTVFTGDEFHELTELLHTPLEEDIVEIRGVTASKGRVQGVVRVCESISDIDSVQPGEILVASMTRPEYLPAMQKAAAFITDEGGITCHAAIIAREMQKPCIIGTKIASRVLRNGDLVEVDAEQGIVRIL